MKLRKKEEKEVKKGKLGDITFDVEIPRTHAHNDHNLGYLEGEKSMLKKCKEALGE